MQLDTTISVDLENVQNFIDSDKFIQFLLNNTTEFSTAAFILQILNDKLDELRNED